jgi:signal transduction histidine kinase
MVEDITQKKKAEEELISAKLKAEESDRLKTAFLHNVSHEIRTPMNAIIGFSSLMNESDLQEPDRQQYTEIIYQSSNQLLSIINDIVDVANIESGLVKVNLKKTDLNSSLRNLEEQFRLSGKQHKIPITLSAGLPDEKAFILTDNTKLIQILSNLINNSIKFTSMGSIDFGYKPEDSFLEFFVSDTGIGIPQESIGKIFDRFYQVDRTVSRQFGGTGLGLSICKAYVQLLGGNISVISSPGKGTSFVFSLPYLPAE